MADLPKGDRFSHVYLERGEPRGDSPRARRRIMSVLIGVPSLALDGLGVLIEREVGIEIPYSTYGGPLWEQLLIHCELRDFLDIITVAYRHFVKSGRTTVAANWVREVNRIFQEENVRYQVDALGGVHFSIDEEFERSRAATIAVLQGKRYANVSDIFERASTALAAVPPDGKGAIRATFAAAEGLFRLMFNASPRLTGTEIDKQLHPELQRTFSKDATAARATSKLLASFKDWVDACHFYRHEPGKEEIAQPPLAIAINLVSLGSSYIRWLAEFDSAKQ